MTDGLEVWPGKALFINFPSSVHLQGPEAVRELAVEIIESSAGLNRVAMGIHENIPRQDTLLPLVEATCGGELKGGQPGGVPGV